jgi:hypothetical protein
MKAILTRAKLPRIPLKGPVESGMMLAFWLS